MKIRFDSEGNTFPNKELMDNYYEMKEDIKLYGVGYLDDDGIRIDTNIVRHLVNNDGTIIPDLYMVGNTIKKLIEYKLI